MFLCLNAKITLPFKNVFFRRTVFFLEEALGKSKKTLIKW